jgi:hypothetical protein
MNRDRELRQLEAEVRQLEEATAAGNLASRQTSRSAMGVTSALALTISVFLLANYFNLRSAWTREKFQQSLAEELGELSPKAAEEARLLGRALLPVYATEGRKQLQELAPEISSRSEEELLRLNNDLLATVHDKLLASQRRLLQAAEKMVFDSYPGLRDPAARAELEQRLRSVTEDAIEQALVDFDRRFSEQVRSLQEAILKFDVADGDESVVDLQKRFIHIWLQLLDQEIMEL